MSKKLFDKSYCLTPPHLTNECSGKIVKAHTVPKSMSLKTISRHGHVYYFEPQIESIMKGDDIILPKLTGINKASTFTGFCGFHDNNIFNNIDNQPIKRSKKQCCLLAYRSLSRELFMKNYALSLIPLYREADRGKSLYAQKGIQGFISSFAEGIEASLTQLKHYKSIFEKLILYNDYSSIRSLLIRIKVPPPVMCSSSIYPDQDFNGNQLQDLGNLDIIPSVISFTSYYDGEYGIIVFIWLPDSDSICIPFTDSIKSISPARLINSLLRFFFEYSENLNINPPWWENLDEEYRDILIDRMNYTSNPLNSRKNECLTEDSMQFGEWPVSDILSL